MEIEIELFDDAEGCHIPTKLPARYEVCHRCDGHGTQCTLGAMTGEEYHEICDGDPDFPENYKSGMYSRPCGECKGNRVVAVVDTDALDSAMRARVEQHYSDIADDESERRREQRYGY